METDRFRLVVVGAGAISRADKGAIRLTGKDTQDHLCASFNRPIKIDKAQPAEPLDRVLVAQQLRDIKHDPARCHRELGFQPPLSFSESMRSFRDGYQGHFEPDSTEWQLLGEAASPWS